MSSFVAVCMYLDAPSLCRERFERIDHSLATIGYSLEPLALARIRGRETSIPSCGRGDWNVKASVDCAYVPPDYDDSPGAPDIIYPSHPNYWRIELSVRPGIIFEPGPGGRDTDERWDPTLSEHTCVTLLTGIRAGTAYAMAGGWDGDPVEAHEKRAVIHLGQIQSVVLALHREFDATKTYANGTTYPLETHFFSFKADDIRLWVGPENPESIETCPDEDAVE